MSDSEDDIESSFSTTRDHVLDVSLEALKQVFQISAVLQ